MYLWLVLLSVVSIKKHHILSRLETRLTLLIPFFIFEPSLIIPSLCWF